MTIEFSNGKSLCPTFGWTHVASSRGGKTIYISGQVSVNEKGEVVGKGDLNAQVTQTFENLKNALAAAGATFKDVVKSSFYVVGLKSEQVPILREVRARYFNQQNPPTSTLVGVQALVNPDWLIEIELIAVIE
ncbi:MAG: RidA family protein [Gemmataceae bacterium]|nr:RidA family protein [Gemmataceae bacterium]